MPRRTTLLLNLILILSLAFSGTLSGILIPTPVVTGTSSAPVVTPGEAGPELASRRVKRDRKHDRARKDRKQDRKQKDRKADRKQKDKKQDRKKGKQQTQSGRVGDVQQFCTGPELSRLHQTELCTHGPDPAPPGFAVDSPVPLLSAAEAEQEAAAIVCEDDGITGFRVQVLYARGSSGTALNESVKTSIRGWVGQADQIFRNSADETNGIRNLRFVHDTDPACQPDVEEIIVSQAALSSFGAMIDEFEERNYSREDRIYLIFVDATEYCGIGTLFGDSRASRANWNNVGPSYSRVDRGCWSGFVAAHEVMHNLGGVQRNAPNATQGFHCIDEWDVMCYSDAEPGVPQMSTVCLPHSSYSTRFDCNDDDYYNTNPSPKNYLSSFWNPAGNQFLIETSSSSDDTVPPTVEWTAPFNIGGPVDVTSGTVALTVTAADNEGIERVEFWRRTGPTGRWLLIGSDQTFPYVVSLNAAALSPGVHELSADVTDDAGNWSDARTEVNRVAGNVAPPPPPADTTTHVKDKKKDQKKKKGKHKNKRKKRR